MKDLTYYLQRKGYLFFQIGVFLIVSAPSIASIFIFLSLIGSHQNDSKSFIENFIRVNNFINLIPELVEKKEPPMITKIKKINIKLLGVSLNEIPIFEILLDIATKIVGKLFSEFKKTKENEIIISK